MIQHIGSLLSLESVIDAAFVVFYALNRFGKAPAEPSGRAMTQPGLLPPPLPCSGARVRGRRSQRDRAQRHINASSQGAQLLCGFAQALCRLLDDGRPAPWATVAKTRFDAGRVNFNRRGSVIADDRSHETFPGTTQLGRLKDTLAVGASGSRSIRLGTSRGSPRGRVQALIIPSSG